MNNNLAARSGFEPKLTESESAVLPLHHRANNGFNPKMKGVFFKKNFTILRKDFHISVAKFLSFLEKIKS